MDGAIGSDDCGPSEAADRGEGEDQARLIVEREVQIRCAHISQRVVTAINVERECLLVCAIVFCGR